MPPKNKKIFVRSQIRRTPITSGILKDLLQVRPPSQLQVGQVLATDGEQGSLRLLEDEGFSPYRIPKPAKHDEPPLLTRPIHQQSSVIPEQKGKCQELTTDSLARFMSISEIDLQRKQVMKLARSKQRSLSVMELKFSQLFDSKQGNTRYSRKANNNI
jgi:hypothetical protein